MTARKDNNWVQQQAAAATEERIFADLVAFIAEHGYSPTRRELAERTGLAYNTIRNHLRPMIAAGRVTDHGGRTLRPSE